MDKTESSTFGKSVPAENEEQSSATSKGVVVRRRSLTNMVQNVIVIWLDNNIDVNSADGQSTIAELRRVSENIHTFRDRDQSIDFLTDIDNDEACMIISGALCQNIVPLIHDVTQLQTIFILCRNKNRYDQWARDWPKIKGVFTDIMLICKVLKKTAYHFEQNAIPFSIVASGDDVTSKTLGQLNSSFMYTQIIKEILSTIKFEGKHVKEFFDYSRDKLIVDDNTLKNVNKLEREYHAQTPIWWYTSEQLFYSVLNRALRAMELDIIIKMGFFINSLHCQIQELHIEQSHRCYTDNLFTVYRGQGMSKTDFDQLTNTKGGLMSFNNFLSTSKKRDVSLLFAESNVSDHNLVGILFVMTINPSKSTTSFAYVSDVGYYGDAEDEVLFSMHTIFRIHDIKPLNGEKRLVQVDLILTTNNDEGLRVLTEHIREETFPEASGWYRLGSILLKIGQFEKAQDVYETLLEQATNTSEQASIYHQLGSIKLGQKEYKEAITLFEKAVEMYKIFVPSNHPNLSMSYNNIAGAYTMINEYSKAFSFYERALEIQQQTLPPNHSDFAASYSNIATMHSKMGEYSKAHLYSEKAFAIRQQALPSNHPDQAISYNKIAEKYTETNEYLKAFLFYEKALTIRQQSLPPNHIDLASSYDNIGEMYRNMGEFSKALSSQEKALAIRHQLLPSNHSDFVMSYTNIGVVYRNMGECSKALSCYIKALDIEQQSLPPNYSNLAKLYNNIGVTYKNLDDYSNALSSYMTALELEQKSFPLNHPNFAGFYNNIGSVYYKMGEYSKARSYYERAVEIGDRSLPSNNPHLQVYRNNLDLVVKKI